MATTVQADIEVSRDLDKQLSAQLAKGDTSLTLIAASLEAIRSSSEAAILKDFSLAAANRAEDRLWSAHQRVNTYFRVALNQAQKQATQFVTTRKIRADYVRFVKSSQRFYRSYILHLSATYGGIPTLERVAQILNRDHATETTIPRSTVVVTENTILLSCHRTLLQLGDLSRYRETEVGGSKRDWSAAIGFYDLAGSILPSSGQSHNQLAVLALADGNIFRAVYHLYRSLSTEDPHPLAEFNLNKACLKIASNHDKEGSTHNNNMQKDKSDSEVLLGWYSRLLALCRQGQSDKGKSQERIALEFEVLGRFAVFLKKGTSDSTLHRIVITNIASAHAAQVQFEAAAESGEHINSYLSLLRLNLRCFIVMLDQFKAELDDILTQSHDGQKVEVSTIVLQLTPGTTKLLPQLRLYSIWLRKNLAVVSNLANDASVDLHERFWSVYAQTLSVIADAFPADSLPELTYMLEEDVDTVGFRPLHCEANRGIWYDGDKQRTTWHESQEIPRLAFKELLFRIRGILVTGLELAFDAHSPITFDQDHYCFRLNDASIGTSAPSANHGSVSDKSRPAQAVQPQRSSAEDRQFVVPPSLPKDQTQDMDVEAQRMVDSLLVESFSDEEIDGLRLGTALDDRRGSSSAVFPVLNSRFPFQRTDLSDNDLAFSTHSLTRQRSALPLPGDSAMGHVSSKQTSHGQSSIVQQTREGWTSVSPSGVLANRNGSASRGAIPMAGPSTPGQSGRFSRLDSISRSSPMPRSGFFEHGRHLSTDSTHSRNSIWSPDESWTALLTREGQAGVNAPLVLGNGSFDGTHSMGSSLLFGAGSSPWNMSPRERQLSESPRMPSIWDTPSALRQTPTRPLS